MTSDTDILALEVTDTMSPSLQRYKSDSHGKLSVGHHAVFIPDHLAYINKNVTFIFPVVYHGPKREHKNRL